MKRKLLALWMAMATVFTAAPAAAVSAEDEKKAATLLQDGKAKYQAGQYEAAAKTYMEAYAYAQTPAPVYNAARAYEAAGLLAEAKPLYELYIQIDRGDDADSVAGRADAQRRLNDVVAKLAERKRKREAAAAQAAAPIPAPVPVPAPVVAPAPAPVAAPKPAPSPVVMDAPPPADPPREPPPSIARAADAEWTTQKTVGVVGVATGGALIVTSIIVAIVANSDLAALDARLNADHVANTQGLILHGDVTQPEMDSGIATYNKRQIAAGVLGGVGAAFVVTGGLLWWLDDGQPSPPARVRPSVSLVGDGALLTFAGRF